MARRLTQKQEEMFDQALEAASQLPTPKQFHPDKIFRKVKDLAGLEKFIQEQIPSEGTQLYYTGRLAHAYEFCAQVDPNGQLYCLINGIQVHPWETVLHVMKNDPKLLVA